MSRSATIPTCSSSLLSSASRNQPAVTDDYPPLDLPLRWRDPPDQRPIANVSRESIIRDSAPLQLPLRWRDPPPARTVRNHAAAVVRDSSQLKQAISRSDLLARPVFHVADCSVEQVSDLQSDLEPEEAAADAIVELKLPLCSHDLALGVGPELSRPDSSPASTSSRDLPAALPALHATGPNPPLYAPVTDAFHHPTQLQRHPSAVDINIVKGERFARPLSLPNSQLLSTSSRHQVRNQPTALARHHILMKLEGSKPKSDREVDDPSLLPMATNETLADRKSSTASHIIVVPTTFTGDCCWFFQLLDGAMTSPTARPCPPPNYVVPIDAPWVPTVTPCFLPPAALLESHDIRGQFSVSSSCFGYSNCSGTNPATSRISFSIRITENFVPQSMVLPVNLSLLQQILPPTHAKAASSLETKQTPSSDEKSQSTVIVTKPSSEDGYKWRKYGQKQVKSTDRSPSYYRCKNADCSAKKIIESYPKGQVIEVVYKGQHSHEQPHKAKLSKKMGLQSSGSFGIAESLDISCIVTVESDPSTSKVDQNSSNDNLKHQLYCSSNYEGDDSNKAEEDPYDEPKPKRRLSLSTLTNPPPVFRTVKQPKVVMLNTVAGHYVYDINYDGRATEAARGGPIARIAIYLACWDSGSYDADLLAAFNNAIEDGVDIISLSLSPESPHEDYFNDAISIGSFHAMISGILVISYDGKSLNEMTEKNLLSWNALIGEFSDNQLPQMKLKFVDGIRSLLYDSSWDKEFISRAISIYESMQICGSPKEPIRLLNDLVDMHRRCKLFDPGGLLIISPYNTPRRSQALLTQGENDAEHFSLNISLGICYLVCYKLIIGF